MPHAGALRGRFCCCVRDWLCDRLTYRPQSCNCLSIQLESFVLVASSAIAPALPLQEEFKDVIGQAKGFKYEARAPQEATFVAQK